MQNLGPRLLNRPLNRNLVDKGGAVGVFATAPLDLRFALQKVLDPRITFTRASSATYAGSDGTVKTAATNEARFESNPATGESLGLLVEEPRINVVTSSADFSTGWTPTRATVTTNQTTAPDGTTTADLLTEDTSTNTHVLQSTFAVTAGTSYTLSVWVKQNTSVSPTRNIRLFFSAAQFTTQVAAGFDLTTGVITPTNSPVATSLQFYANGWVRVSCTATCTTTAAASSVSFQMTSGVSTSYTGGSSGLYLWGAQFEAGAFMTSYIPTTGTIATRAADVASITGSNFSSFYNQTEGTVFAQFGPYGNGGLSKANGVFDINSGSTANSIAAGMGVSVTPGFSVATSSVSQVYATTTNLTPSAISKIACAYKVNNFAISANASSPAIDTSGTVPTVNQMLIGTNSGSNNELSGVIRRLTYWPTRLADTTLQSITAP